MIWIQLQWFGSEDSDPDQNITDTDLVYGISNVCSSPYLYHKYFHYTRKMTRYRYDTKNYYRYQSFRPLLTKSLRGLLLGVGDGVKEG
jgi:hypothetical protein